MLKYTYNKPHHSLMNNKKNRTHARTHTHTAYRARPVPKTQILTHNHLIRHIVTHTNTCHTHTYRNAYHT